jgi:hypothetical protein
MAGEFPVSGGGVVAVVSPGGVSGTVPEDKLEVALKMGYRLEQPEEHTERRREATYAERPLEAAALGAASAVTAGGSDVILNAMAGEGGDNAIREISARNRGARVVGELGGLLTGVGAAGAIMGAGRAAGKAAGGGLRGAAAAGATEGALIGVGHTVSNAGLSKDPLTAEAVAGDLARNVLLSSTLGGAGGALGNLVSRAASKAKDGFARLEDNLARAAAPGEKAALEAARKAELARLAEAAKPERAALAEELTVLRGDQKALREALKSRLGSAPEGVLGDLKVAERSLAGVVGNARKLAQQPERALDAVANYGTHLRAALGSEPPAIAGKILDRVEQLRMRLDAIKNPSSGELTRVNERLAEIAKAGKAKTGLAGEVAKGALDKAAGAVAFGAAAEVTNAIDVPGAGLLAFLLAGKLGPRLSNAVGGQLGARAADVGSRIARAAGRVAGVVEKGAPVITARAAAIAPEAFEDVRTAVLEAQADPVAFEKRIDAQLDGVRLHDPALADQLKQVQLRGAMHLAAVAPRAPGAPTLADSTGKVSRLERDRFLRRVDVVLDPTSLLDSLEDGMLTPAQVETGDAVYVELMGMLRQRLVEQMAGREISPQRRLALSILLGAPATPSLRPENIAAAQARMNAEIASVARPPNRGSAPAPQQPPGRQAPAEQTLSSQRLAGK